MPVSPRSTTLCQAGHGTSGSGTRQHPRVHESTPEPAHVEITVSGTDVTPPRSTFCPQAVILRLEDHET
jgi:hypothetical protein